MNKKYTSDFVFIQKGTRCQSIPSTWILLDSASTVSVIKNKVYVRNIRESSRASTALTNGGQQILCEVADTRYFRQVWFNEASMANILALAGVCKYARVTMESSVKKSIFVHRKDGHVIEFR